MDEFHLPNYRGQWRQEPSAAAEACIYLARAESPLLPEFLPQAVERGAGDEIDRAACAVARAFAGERGRMSAALFAFESWVVAANALAAAEKENTREALAAVVTGGTRHRSLRVQQWEVLTAQRMSGQRWTANAADEERAERYGEDVRAWWAAHGATFEPRPRRRWGTACLLGVE